MHKVCYSNHLFFWTVNLGKHGQIIFAEEHTIQSLSFCLVDDIDGKLEHVLFPKLDCILRGVTKMNIESFWKSVSVFQMACRYSYLSSRLQGPVSGFIKQVIWRKLQYLVLSQFGLVFISVFHWLFHCRECRNLYNNTSNDGKHCPISYLSDKKRFF